MLDQRPRPGENSVLRKANAQRIADGIETSVKVWEMKKAGLSFRQIATQLGMSPSGTHEAYKRVIKQMKEELAENAEDWLQLQLARMEEVAAFQFRVMKGMDIRSPELKERHRREAEERGEDPDKLEVPLSALPTIEERLGASRDLVKTGESLRKMLGLDAPEKSDLRVTGVVGTIDLTELGPEELLRETQTLGTGLRTLPAEEYARLMGGEDSTIEANEVHKAQPEEV